jgi:uncharacterized protein (DUF1684 family)
MLSLVFIFKIAEGQSAFEKEIEMHREKYTSDFITDKHAPLKEEDIPFLDFYAADQKFKVACTFKAGGKSLPFEIPTSSGNTKTYARFGQLKFTIDGKKYKLTVYRSLALMKNPLYKDYLFIPFKDETSSYDTYGGGRYLDLRMGDLVKNEIIIDFNKAYNPYCAYSAGYSCPIPPKENYLKINIMAGEKNFKGKMKY